MSKNIICVNQLCVGCRSCEQVCPVKCISIKPDKEGFLYPEVDEKICVECGKCLKCCPVGRSRENKRSHAVYGLKNKDKIRGFCSASGGAADLAAQYVISQNGVVFGCAYNEHMQVCHIEVTNAEDLWKIQSSKYVQSNLKDCYSLMKKRLEERRKVLFIGTPCQVAGFYAYMGNREVHNLYTIDLICHGVPSPMFFEKYIQYQEKKIGEKIEKYNFRYKGKKGWGTHLRIDTDTRSEMKPMTLDKYGVHFFAGDCYRECCYKCEYANLSRIGDITCGDFWGVEKNYPKFNDSNGVSLVLVNSMRGEDLFANIKKNAFIIKVPLERVLPYQKNLREPTGRPDERDSFYKNIDDDRFIYDIKTGAQLKERIKSFLPRKVIMILKSKIR